MSFKLVEAFWGIDLSSSERSVAQAIAKHANDDGTGAFPSMPTIMRLTNLSKSTVRRAINGMASTGLLTLADSERKGGRGHCMVYTIDITKGVKKTPNRQATRNVKGYHHDTVPDTGKGITTTPNSDDERVSDCNPFDPIKGVMVNDERVSPCAEKGVMATPPWGEGGLSSPESGALLNSVNESGPSAKHDPKGSSPDVAEIEVPGCADPTPIGQEANAAYQQRFKARYGRYRKLLGEEERSLKSLRKDKRTDFYRAIDAFFASDHPFVVQNEHAVGMLKGAWGDVWLAEDPAAAVLRKWPPRREYVPRTVPMEDIRKQAEEDRRTADDQRRIAASVKRTARESAERARVDAAIEALDPADRTTLEALAFAKYQSSITLRDKPIDTPVTRGPMQTCRREAYLTLWEGQE